MFGGGGWGFGFVSSHAICVVGCVGFFLMGCCVFASLYHIIDPLDVSTTNFVGVWYWYVSLFFVLGGFSVGNLLLGGLLLVL